jgi:hypothetical protein
MKAAFALLGIGLVAVTVVFGACLVVLRNDYASLRAELSRSSSHVPPSVITRPEFRHRRWTVTGPFAVLPARCGK